MPKSPRAPTSSSQNFTYAQKQQLAAYHAEQMLNNPSYLQKDLSAWAKATFNLSYTPSKATIYRILHNPSTDVFPSPSKKKLPTKLEELEHLLTDWVDTQQARGVMLNHHLIKQQGQIFQARLNTSLPEDKKLSLKFSNGWLQKFSNRNSLSQHKLHGEAGSVDQQFLDQQLPALKQLLHLYQPEDIWNADETGLFYSMPPVRTIATRPAAGLKKDKTRITILFACNSTGSEKLEPFFIGKADQPRAFKRSTAAQLGIHYAANQKAWMTSSLFTSWLQHLDAHIGQTPGRHILLLLDNFKGHGSTEKPLTELHNITIHFLPPNTTSRIQPLDAGIIAAFKKHYRIRQYSQALLEAEMGGTDIYKVDILTAIRLSQQIWRELSTTTIKNCWRHTGLVEWEEAKAQGEDAMLDLELDETLRRLTEVTVHDVLHPAGEEEEEEKEEEEGQEANKEGVKDITTPPDTPNRLSQTLLGPVMSPQEKIEILRSAKAILEGEGLLSKSVLDAFTLCSTILASE
ncbi:related to transposases [Ustilago trichophora]|uniref:Related to transposases n=1 Tax=Ustilago trichophora TaxID=86804 RepID=A0A5C3EC45_9BASI|nr:related to transposases [Ustilago trichophora]